MRSVGRSRVEVRAKPRATPRSTPRSNPRDDRNGTRGGEPARRAARASVSTRDGSRGERTARARLDPRAARVLFRGPSPPGAHGDERGGGHPRRRGRLRGSSRRAARARRLRAVRGAAGGSRAARARRRRRRGDGSVRRVRHPPPRRRPDLPRRVPNPRARARAGRPRLRARLVPPPPSPPDPPAAAADDDAAAAASLPAASRAALEEQRRHLELARYHMEMATSLHRAARARRRRRRAPSSPSPAAPRARRRHPCASRRRARLLAPGRVGTTKKLEPNVFARARTRLSPPPGEGAPARSQGAPAEPLQRVHTRGDPALERPRPGFEPPGRVQGGGEELGQLPAQRAERRVRPESRARRNKRRAFSRRRGRPPDPRLFTALGRPAAHDEGGHHG